jgi:perosamine synthetase
MLSEINPELYTTVESVKTVLLKLNNNGLTSVVIVSNTGQFLKVVGDGDIRRFLSGGGDLKDLITLVKVPEEQKIVQLPVNRSEVAKIFSSQSNIRLIPVVDSDGMLRNIITEKSFEKSIPVSQPKLTEIEINNCTSALADNWISSQGKFINDFEAKISDDIGGKAVCVSNGTVAIELSIKALNLGDGKKIGVPNFTFGATVNAILNAGSIPVLLDVCPVTWKVNINEDELVALNLDGIILVNIYGLSYRKDEISFFKLHCNKLIIDSAEAVRKNIFKDDEYSDAMTFSFFANKILTTGEGGAVVFRDHEVKNKAKVLRDHGMDIKRRYWHVKVGSNYRMTNLQAAIGLGQLQRIDSILEERKLIFDRYNVHFDNSDIINNKNMASGVSPWLYTITLDDKINVNSLLNFLSAHLIEAREIFYPMSLMEIFKPYKYKTSYISEELLSSGICLPTFNGLSLKDVDKISNKIVRFLENE